MKYLIIVLSSFLISATMSNTSSLKFEQMPLKEALLKAKKEGKGVFMVYMAPWCGTCLFMKQNTFTSEKLISTLEKDFICIKFNKDKVFTYPEELGDVSWETLPAMFFFDKSGELQKQLEGHQSPDDLISIANEVLK
ncbi:MAG: thioredoxin family protein [Bacteroidia bacterium]